MFHASCSIPGPGYRKRRRRTARERISLIATRSRRGSLPWRRRVEKIKARICIATLGMLMLPIAWMLACRSRLSRPFLRDRRRALGLLPQQRMIIVVHEPPQLLCFASAALLPPLLLLRGLNKRFMEEGCSRLLLLLIVIPLGAFDLYSSRALLVVIVVVVVRGGGKTSHVGSVAFVVLKRTAHRIVSSSLSVCILARAPRRFSFLSGSDLCVRW